MVAQLWTPPNAKTLPRPGLPSNEDIRLVNGLILRYHSAFSNDVGQGVIQRCRRWVGAKGLSVIASIDATPHGDLLHVSLARKDRLPTWEEVRQVRNAFYPPTVDVMMILPREQDYVNVHQYCFHLQQTPVGWGLQ